LPWPGAALSLMCVLYLSENANPLIKTRILDLRFKSVENHGVTLLAVTHDHDPLKRFYLADLYPLKMKVVGVLQKSYTAARFGKVTSEIKPRIAVGYYFFNDHDTFDKAIFIRYIKLTIMLIEYI
jgi:hypothetical protein